MDKRNLRSLQKSSVSVILATILLITTFFVMPVQQQLITGAYGQTNELVAPSSTSITRSFTYPILEFRGQTITSVTQKMVWNTDGTTIISDSRGYQYSINIPLSIGTTLLLLQNSTTIDQKIITPSMQYDVYWKPVQNSNGYVDKYKFTIVGSSSGNSSIVLKIDGGKYFDLKKNGFSVSQNAESINRSLQLVSADKSLNWTTILDAAKGNGTTSEANNPLHSSQEGIGLDWSDAIASGYQPSFNSNDSTLTIPVKGSFFIDPTTVSTVTQQISPATTDYFEGETREITTNVTTINVFYYDGSNIVYRTSTDSGKTWSASTSTGSGTLASDTYRWTVASTYISTTQYLSVLYWAPAGSNMNFYAIRGTVGSSSISWSSPILLGFTAANSGSCGSGGACAAVAAATADNGAIFAAFRWISGGASTYSYQIMKSTDGGLNWSTSLSQVNGVSSFRPAMAMVALNNTRMLFAYALYNSAEISYRVFDGTSWGSVQVTSGSGMSTNTVKQISAVSTFDRTAYIAYLTSGISGTLKVARFSNTGSFQAFETADSSLSHTLPSIKILDNGLIHILTLSGSKVYDTKKAGSSWLTPNNPYGTTFTSPDQLSGAIGHPSAVAGIWREGTSSPYNLRFGMINPRFVANTTVQISPTLSDSYEGEKRLVADSENKVFAFYYDGSNIVYKYSNDTGFTYSDTAISVGTGTLASDNYRWTVVSATISNHRYIAVLYWVAAGTNMNFYAKRGEITGSTIAWGSAVLLGFTAANPTDCGTGGACAASVAATDNGDNIYAAFRYKPNGSTYVYQIMKSTDGGLNWSTSLPQTDTGSNIRVAMGLTKLASGKMLFVYARYASGELSYRVFDGTSWGSKIDTSGAGMAVNTNKQISAASNSSGTAYVTFLTGGYQGTLKVARFSNTGSFQAFETADSSLSHWLPSIVVPRNDTVFILTLSGGKVYEVKKVGNTWQAPTNPYGTVFSSPDQLTAGIPGSSYVPSVWTEGSSPYMLVHGGFFADQALILCLVADLTLKCQGSKVVIPGYSTFQSAPGENNFNFYRAHVCGILPCVDTNFSTRDYPPTLTDDFGNVYNWNRGAGTVEAIVFTVPVSDPGANSLWVGVCCSSGSITTLNVPALPIIINRHLTYYYTDPNTGKEDYFTISMRLGYLEG